MSERCYLSFDRYEDSEALDNAMKANKYKAFIDGFDNDVFRSIIKYDNYDLLEIKGLSDFDKEIVMGVVEKLRELYWSKYKDLVEG